MDTSRIHLHPPTVDIFKRHHYLGFFKLLKGYDDDITYETSMALNPQSRTSATTMVRTTSITINPKGISRVKTLPLGVQQRKEEKASNTLTKTNFFTKYEKPIEDKNLVRRDNLSYPWDEVAYHILKFISCEGRLSVVYGYQFKMLHELIFQPRFPIAERLSVPYFSPTIHHRNEPDGEIGKATSVSTPWSHQANS